LKKRGKGDRDVLKGEDDSSKKKLRLELVSEVKAKTEKGESAGECRKPAPTLVDVQGVLGKLGGD